MGRINVGAINGRRTVTFKVTNDGIVFRRGWTLADAEFLGGLRELQEHGAVIPAREAFRRWKVARKAWQTRRRAKQLLLKL